MQFPTKVLSFSPALSNTSSERFSPLAGVFSPFAEVYSPLAKVFCLAFEAKSWATRTPPCASAVSHRCQPPVPEGGTCESRSKSISATASSVSTRKRSPSASVGQPAALAVKEVQGALGADDSAGTGTPGAAACEARIPAAMDNKSHGKSEHEGGGGTMKEKAPPQPLTLRRAPMSERAQIKMIRVRVPHAV